MPGREPLSSLVNFPALEAEIERVIGLVRSIQEALDSVGKANSLFKNAKGASDQKAATDGLIQSNNQLLQVQKQLEAEQQKSLTLETALAKQLAIKKELNKQQAADLRAEAREAAGLNDAYKKLEIQYNAAQRAAKNLAATPGTPQAQIDAANKNALALSNQLKSVDAAVGQHQRKVGDYVGAISILDKSLQEVKAKLDQFTASGNENSAEAARLREEYNLLNALVNQQAKGFTSVTMELRANERALVSLRAAGLEGTEAFEQLQAAVVKATRQMNEFRKEQKLLESAAPNLAALTTVAKGLGGAYALGAGASALFADGNEKVEKELQKLVAIMTILQGLNELHELAEKKGAIATLANAAAQRLKNFVMTGSAAGTKAATVATEENTVAQATNIEATEASAVAAGENAVAMEGEAAATEVATVATKSATTAMVGLRVALLATGIGALLILLPLVANGMGLFGKSLKDRQKEIEDLLEAEKKLNSILIEQLNLMNGIANIGKRSMEAQLALAEAAGVNDYKRLSLKKQIAEQEKSDAQQQINDLGATNARQAELLATIQDFTNKQQAAMELFKANTESGKEREAKADKDLADMYEKQAAAQKEIYEAGKKARDDLYAAKLKSDQVDAERAKLSAEEQRKLLEATLKDKADRIMENNKLILSSEGATMQERIKAMQSNLQQQKAIIAAEREEKLGDPSLTPTGRALVVAEAAQAEYKATLASKEEIRKLTEEYYKRNRDAAAEIQKLEIEDQIKANDLLLQNDKLHFDERFSLISDSYLKRRVLAGAQMMKDLDNENLTAEERKAIIAKYDSDILALTVEFHKNQEEERKRAHEKEMQEAIAAGDQRKANILKAQADADIALNNKTGNGAGAELERKKKDQAFEYNKQILQNQIQTDFLLVNSTKEGTKERADAEQKLAEDRMHLSDLVKNKSIADEKERRDMIKKYSEEAAEIAISAVDGQFQHEINRIQDRINENTKLYDKEKTDVANSTLNAQQKAAQLIVINEQQKAREDKLNQQKKNEELRQAKFDRDAQILKIIGNTLVDASAQGWITPQAIAIEVAGAAAVAELLAKPLPHFASGTDNAPRGLGIWGEAGQEAKIDRYGNVEFSPNRATPVMLQGGERIIPHDELNEFLYNNMLQATATMIIPSRQDESAKEIRRLQGIVQEQGDRADRAARNKSVPRVTIKINPGWDAYIRKSVKE